MSEKSIQETYAPNLACFGCGPANEKGLHIRSFPNGEDVVAEWQPQPVYEAFTGILSGGIIGTLLDCHCNWTAAWCLMNKAGLDHPPCTVTADYAIKLLRPTSTDKPVRLLARLVESTDDRAIVEGELIADEKYVPLAVVLLWPSSPAIQRTIVGKRLTLQFSGQRYVPGLLLFSERKRHFRHKLSSA